MSTIRGVQNRIKALDINKEIKTSIESTKNEVADLNRERMLAGKRADGSSMPNYSKISVDVFGYPPGPIRLKATGSFQEKITIEVTNIAIVQDSSDSKSKMLQGRYGETIFGMDKGGKEEYIKDLRPQFQKQVRDKLGL